MRIDRAKDVADQFLQRRFVMPVLEDANAVQLALMKVMQMLVRGQMDTKMAGLLLYGLQTASSNLRHTTFEAEKSTDVVIDRDTVNQTCINGPQWFARDFADEALADEVEENEIEEGDIQEDEVQENKLVEKEDSVAVAASGEHLPSDPAARNCRPAKLRTGKLRTGKPRTDKRKRPEAAAVEEGPTWAQNLLRRIEAARDGVEPDLIPDTGIN
jgi:hypothetical protein